MEAEIEADAAALDALATDDFTLIGPAGFVLGKQHWLDSPHAFPTRRTPDEDHQRRLA
jgi:hypothetical protein